MGCHNALCVLITLCSPLRSACTQLPHYTVRWVRMDSELKKRLQWKKCWWRFKFEKYSLCCVVPIHWAMWTASLMRTQRTSQVNQAHIRANSIFCFSEVIVSKINEIHIINKKTLIYFIPCMIFHPRQFTLDLSLCKNLIQCAKI